jgi:hypothetical protein
MADSTMVARDGAHSGQSSSRVTSQMAKGKIVPIKKAAEKYLPGQEARNGWAMPAKA